MGTSAQVVVRGGRPDLADIAQVRIAELETLWSRFNPRSEISRLNAAPRGRPTIVSHETYRLIETAVAAWHGTTGCCDPTVLDAMITNGYDRTLTAINAPTAFPTASTPTHRTQPAPGCLGIVLNRTLRSVALPEGVGIDPGGIGKGLAGDMVAEEVLSLGADGVLVDIGGDIRVAGDGPHGGAWIIDIEHPLDPERALLHLALYNTGIATSSTLRRRWTQNGLEHHHLVDPRSGHPIATPLVAATVIAPDASRAEALTKAILVSGELSACGTASAVAVDIDGKLHATADLYELLI